MKAAVLSGVEAPHVVVVVAVLRALRALYQHHSSRLSVGVADQ